MDYHQKYLKYKTKYLELKAQLGKGGTSRKPIVTGPCQITDCVCMKFIRNNKDNLCSNTGCGHSDANHFKSDEEWTFDDD